MDSYYQRNRERILKRKREYRKNESIETKIQLRQYNRNYYLKNKRNHYKIVNPKLQYVRKDSFDTPITITKRQVLLSFA